MAAINFVKGEQYYTAEFQINGPVNVHIERAEAGALYFRQRSIDHGSYDLINGANWNNRGDLTIDTAIQGVVYPMWIKIESASEPTLAEMVEGEQSGGGAGTESTMEYLDVSGLDEGNLRRFLVYGYVAKFSNNGETIFYPTALVSTSSEFLPFLSAISIDFTTVITFTGTSQNMTIKEVLLQTGSTPITEEELAAIPRITKEQFYSLEA